MKTTSLGDAQAAVDRAITAAILDGDRDAVWEAVDHLRELAEQEARTVGRIAGYREGRLAAWDELREWAETNWDVAMRIAEERQ